MAEKRTINQSPKLPPEERRRQLMKAAHKLFLKKGFVSTTVDEIAKSAGLTKGALYFHFKSKEDILFEIVRHFTEHHDVLLDRRSSTRRTPTQTLRDLVDSQFGECDCDFADIVDIWVQAWRIPRIKRFITTRARRRLLMEAEALDPKSLPKGISSQTIVVMIVAMVDGLATLNMVSPKLVDIEAQVAAMTTLLQQGSSRQ